MYMRADKILDRLFLRYLKTNPSEIEVSREELNVLDVAATERTPIPKLGSYLWSYVEDCKTIFGLPIKVI